MPEIIVPNDHGDDGDDDTCTNSSAFYLYNLEKRNLAS